MKNDLTRNLKENGKATSRRVSTTNNHNTTHLPHFAQTLPHTTTSTTVQYTMHNIRAYRNAKYNTNRKTSYLATLHTTHTTHH